MNVLLLGPQGSGKGTQARILCEKYGFFYFESGAYLRKMAQDNSNIKKIMDEENLYDDILFDGFPRTVEQYEFLKDWLDDKKVKLDLLIVIEISIKETIRRLSSRRMDPDTGKIYNLLTDKPPVGVDIKKLIQRDDDKSEAIKKRLAWHEDRVKLLIARLKKEIKVIEIDGERPVQEISADLARIIDDTNKN